MSRTHAGALKQQVIDAGTGEYEWIRRNFQLVVGTGMIHIKSPDAGNDLIPSLSIVDAAYAKAWSISSPAVGYGFDIVWESGTIASFLAADKDACHAWVQALNESVRIFNDADTNDADANANDYANYSYTNTSNGNGHGHNDSESDSDVSDVIAFPLDGTQNPHAHTDVSSSSSSNVRPPLPPPTEHSHIGNSRNGVATTVDGGGTESVVGVKRSKISPGKSSSKIASTSVAHIPHITAASPPHRRGSGNESGENGNGGGSCDTGSVGSELSAIRTIAITGSGAGSDASERMHEQGHGEQKVTDHLQASFSFDSPQHNQRQYHQQQQHHQQQQQQPPQQSQSLLHPNINNSMGVGMGTDAGNINSNNNNLNTSLNLNGSSIAGVGMGNISGSDDNMLFQMQQKCLRLQAKAERETIDAQIAREQLVKLQTELDRRSIQYSHDLDKSVEREKANVRAVQAEVEMKVLRATNEAAAHHEIAMKMDKDQSSRELSCIKEELAAERKRYSALLIKEKSSRERAENHEINMRQEVTSLREQVQRQQSEITRLHTVHKADTEHWERERSLIRTDAEAQRKRVEREREECVNKAQIELRSKLSELSLRFDSRVKEMEGNITETIRQQEEGKRLQEIHIIIKQCEKDLETCRTDERRARVREVENLRNAFKERERQTAEDLVQLEQLHTERLQRLEQQNAMLIKKADHAEKEANIAKDISQKGSVEVRLQAIQHMQQAETATKKSESLVLQAASLRKELQESRVREGTYREQLSNSLEENRLQRAELLEAQKQAQSVSSEAHMWKKQAAAADMTHTTAATTVQIARDEISMLEHELARVKEDNYALQRSLQRAEKLVYGTSQDSREAGKLEHISGNGVRQYGRNSSPHLHNNNNNTTTNTNAKYRYDGQFSATGANRDRFNRSKSPVSGDRGNRNHPLRGSYPGNRSKTMRDPQTTPRHPSFGTAPTGRI